MKSILILTSVFLPTPDANGVITHSLAKELIRRKYDVSVLSVKTDENQKDYEVIENIKIYRITDTNFAIDLEKHKQNMFMKNTVLIKRKILNLLKLNQFPYFDREQIPKVSDKAIEIIKENKVTDVLAISKPVSNIAALNSIKKSVKEISLNVILLDTMESTKKPEFMPLKIYNNLIDKALREIPKTYNVFQPINTVERYSKKKYAKKFIYYEYPSMKEMKNFELNEEKKGSEIVITFAGSLDQKNRNPKYFFKSIEELNEDYSNLQVNIYGKNDLGQSELANSKSWLTNHGFTDQELIFDRYINSDFLVNISNLLYDSVPSKIFELFSTGKPIVNFVKNPNDYSLKYFEKYPLSYNFYEWKEFEGQIEGLKTFIIENHNKRVDRDIVDAIYSENTIEFFVNQLESYF